jgi:hypothetical protein
MQASEGKLHLPLHPNRTKHPTVLGAISGVIEEGRFAYPRLAAEHKHRAVSPLSFGQESIEPGTLSFAADQHGRRAAK